MLERCRNPLSVSYPLYGGRGISVCVAWEAFEIFLRDVGTRPSPQHSLDRRDTNGDYSASNCRWATRQEQGRNKRNNVLITVGDVTKTQIEWAEETGIPEQTLRDRRRRGLTGAAIMAPTGAKK